MFLHCVQLERGSACVQAASLPGATPEWQEVMELRREKTDAAWEELAPEHRGLLREDMKSIWDTRRVLDAKENQRRNRAEIFHRRGGWALRSCDP